MLPPVQAYTYMYASFFKNVQANDAFSGPTLQVTVHIFRFTKCFCFAAEHKSAKKMQRI